MKKNLHINFKYFLVCTIIVFSFNAFGQSSVQSSLGNGESNTLYGSFDFSKIKKRLSKISSSYFTDFTGPRLRNFEERTINRDGTLSDTTINNFVQVSVRYPLSRKVSFEINPAFSYYYVDQNNFQMENSTVGFDINYFNYGKLSLSGGINSILFPLNRDSKVDGLRMNPGGFQSLSYRATDQLSLGSWIWFRFPTFKENTNRRNFRSTISPNVSYSISDKLSVLTWVDFFFDHIPNRSLDAIEARRFYDLSLGIGYSFSRAFTFFPYVKSDISEGVYGDKFSVGAWMYGRLF